MIEPKYIGKRISFITTSGEPLVVLLNEETKPNHLKEVFKKFPHMQKVQHNGTEDTEKQETEQVQKPKRKTKAKKDPAKNQGTE